MVVGNSLWEHIIVNFTLYKKKLLMSFLLFSVLFSVLLLLKKQSFADKKRFKIFMVISTDTIKQFFSILKIDILNIIMIIFLMNVARTLSLDVII